ncbi:MAG: hypothetical protein ACLTS6_13125 [Anaerobutyricum sp.]
MVALDKLVESSNSLSTQNPVKGNLITVTAKKAAKKSSSNKSGSSSGSLKTNGNCLLLWVGLTFTAHTTLPVSGAIYPSHTNCPTFESIRRFIMVLFLIVKKTDAKVSLRY